MAWSPALYLKFEDERSRPARDLLARIPLERPRRIVDLGCGPGNSTELLAERFPEAVITGLDSSADMLVAARERLPSCGFVEADIATWQPDEPYDLIFANAVMQWVPDHLDVLERLMDGVVAGGAIAVQVPDNLDEPSHRSMRETAHSGSWRQKFAEPIAREPIADPSAYYDRLKPLSAFVDIWHVAYYHPLADPPTIVQWVSSTGLGPFLERLDVGEREDFLADYTARLANAYPLRADGTVLFRFPRLCLVAVKS